MNIGRVAEYIVLHNQGETYEEIGEQFGVTKQEVSRAIKVLESKLNASSRKKYDIEKIVYRGFYIFFECVDSVTVNKFAKELFGGNSRTAYNKFDRLLKGQNVHLTISTCERMIKMTGMPFEELFELRDGYEYSQNMRVVKTVSEPKNH